MVCHTGKTTGAEDLPRAALDTSHGVSFAVELASSRRVATSGLDLVGRESERELVPWVVSRLEQEGVQLADVRDWVVGTGPGSFTGIRVGIAFTKGVCRCSGGTYRGIPSSLALAAAVAGSSPSEARIGVLHDARRGQVIATVYECSEGGNLVPRGPSRVVPGHELAAALSECSRLVTIHADKVASLLPDTLRERLVCLPGVDAGFLLGVRGLESGEPGVPHSSPLEPVYVRPAVFVPPQPPPRQIGLLRNETQDSIGQAT